MLSLADPNAFSFSLVKHIIYGKGCEIICRRHLGTVPGYVLFYHLCHSVRVGVNPATLWNNNANEDFLHEIKFFMKCYRAP